MPRLEPLRDLLYCLIMQFEFSDSDKAFRDDVRAFLAEKLTPDLQNARRKATSIFEDPSVTKPWHRILYEQGWIAPGWPVEHGGTGWTTPQKYIFETECADHDAPGLSPMGLHMVSHVIMRFGRQDQKDFYLPRILSGEDYWCQGYSEPGAGSDLASLSCRAVADGDAYRINGSKIWTTQAQFADRMFCLVRTDDSGKKQEGITFLLIDMDTPGITIRPITSMGGDHEFNQVFFDDVRVPQANRVGEEGKGWTYAKYLLEFERGARWAVGRLRQKLRQLRAIAANSQSNGHSAADEPKLAAKIATVEADLKAIEFTELRVMSALSNGESPGELAPLLKLQRTEVEQRLMELQTEALGLMALPWEPARPIHQANHAYPVPDWAVAVTPTYLNSRAASIYGGSSEIQHEIMAKLMLQ